MNSEREYYSSEYFTTEDCGSCGSFVQCQGCGWMPELPNAHCEYIKKTYSNERNKRKTTMKVSNTSNSNKFLINETPQNKPSYLYNKTKPTHIPKNSLVVRVEKNDPVQILGQAMSWPNILFLQKNLVS
jgi:hypothetical protein